MSLILQKVQSYLEKANLNASSMSDEVLDEAAKAFRDALDRQFNSKPKDFTLRMSNLGRPTCALQKEKAKAPKETSPYHHVMKMVIGDITEVAAIAILKAANVGVTSTQSKVNLDVAGRNILGTLDLTVDEGYGDGLWDIKTASPWSFKNKFSVGFKAVAENDDFGYVDQLVGYSKGKNLPPRGWIVIEKSTGEWAVVEFPDNFDYKPSLNRMMKTVETVDSSAPFKRCFEDAKETFYKKETGNRILGHACSWCNYKWDCWPGLQLKPNLNSKAQSPGLKYYTYIKDKKNE
jgi:hypothetical protein